MTTCDTSRYRGKRVRQAAGGKRTAGGRRNRGRRAADSGNSLPLCTVICGVIFVLLVAVKLLFPQAAGKLAQSAGRLIGRDADFRTAIAAMGRAVSGEASVRESLQDAYTAVFNPESVPVEPEPEGRASQSLPDKTADRYGSPGAASLDNSELQFLGLRQSSGLWQSSRLWQPPKLEKVPLREIPLEGDASPAEADTEPDPPEGEGEAPEEETGAVSVQTLSLTYNSPALPENASLEERNLGFAYQSPIVGNLTSTFGWRDHPISGGNRFHYGVDMAANTGTDIMAFADGSVYATGESSTLGKYIMLSHEGGYITLYGHCSEISVTGGTVSMGEKIAEVGSTGQTTGSHLHFELHDGALFLNPIYYVEVS